MKLHITTQYMENYGAHDWDGTGQCPQYWKFKGGEDYFIQLKDNTNDEDITALVMAVRGDIETSSYYSSSTIIDWNVVADDFMTEFEKSQLEYEGKITYPAKVLTV